MRFLPAEPGRQPGMQGKAEMRQYHSPEDRKDEGAEHQGHLIQQGQKDAEEAGCKNLSSIHEEIKKPVPVPLIAEPARDVTRRFCDPRAWRKDLWLGSEKKGRAGRRAGTGGRGIEGDAVQAFSPAMATALGRWAAISRTLPGSFCASSPHEVTPISDRP